MSVSSSTPTTPPATHCPSTTHIAYSSASSIGTPVAGCIIQWLNFAEKDAPCVLSVMTWPQMSFTRSRRRR